LGTQGLNLGDPLVDILQDQSQDGNQGPRIEVQDSKTSSVAATATDSGAELVGVWCPGGGLGEEYPSCSLESIR
jgi:hypothetical protein